MGVWSTQSSDVVAGLRASITPVSWQQRRPLLDMGFADGSVETTQVAHKRESNFISSPCSQLCSMYPVGVVNHSCVIFDSELNHAIYRVKLLLVEV